MKNDFFTKSKQICEKKIVFCNSFQVYCTEDYKSIMSKSVIWSKIGGKFMLRVAIYHGNAQYARTFFKLSELPARRRNFGGNSRGSALVIQTALALAPVDVPAALVIEDDENDIHDQCCQQQGHESPDKGFFKKCTELFKIVKFIFKSQKNRIYGFHFKNFCACQCINNKNLLVFYSCNKSIAVKRNNIFKCRFCLDFL